jgi:nucleotide-binding universal stress UspA family protein
VLDTPQVQAYLPFRGKGPLKILYLTRVLFAADGSELAIEAARRAAGMLADFEATVLGVVSPLPLASDTAVAGFESVALPVTSAETVAQIDESVTATIEAGIERTITAIGRPAERRVVHGDPAIEICRVAEEGRFDLVVIGSHGSGFLKQAVLGSVSQHVLHHAPCPVLVVRERDDG